MSVVADLLQRYQATTRDEYRNAVHEIMQELALVGLWRSKFFEHAAFYGGTALRILYGLDRFSEDLDFSLLKPDPSFSLTPFLKAVADELEISGLKVEVKEAVKSSENPIRSAFLKAGTLETFIQIGLNSRLQRQLHSDEAIKIKLEVDIKPPLGFATEVRYLLKPIPTEIRTYVPQDLFAGKMHALLCRPYKVRVKGRDWYDFIWYVSNKIPLHLGHLEARMRQSGHYMSPNVLDAQALSNLLRKKISELHVEAAIEDIRRFVRKSEVLQLWSREFFLSLIPLIHCV